MNMDPAQLQDRVHRGLNTAARAVGADTDAYRPSGTSDPLAARNRFLRLRAAFTSRDGGFAHPVMYGDALWYGIFDAAYTRPGDYLVQADSVWFIAAQQRLLPVLCVLTNRIVSFWRPAAPSTTGVNTYGGIPQRRTKNCSRTGRQAYLVRPDKVIRAPICLATVRALTGRFLCRRHRR